MLPPEAQYFGLWLATSFTLQGAAGALLASIVTPRVADRVLAGALFATAPFLLARVGHVALTTHWTVLVALWLAFRPEGMATPRRSIAAAVALCAFVAGIHPYLTAMVAPIVLTSPWRLWRRGALDGPRAAMAAGAVLAASFAVFAAFGYFAAPGRALGYGYFTADLLTPINPMGWSRLLPSIPVGPGQGEGFAYLGLGPLALLAWAAIAWRRGLAAADLGDARAAVVVVTLLALFAILPTVTIGGLRVLSLKGVLSPFELATAALRSSGRFVWPLAYVVILAAVAATVRSLPGRRATLALAAAVVLQLVDLAPAVAKPRFPVVAWRHASDAWWLAQGHYEEIALHPAILMDGDGAVCRSGPPDPSWISFAYRAWRIGARVNSGYVARLDRTEALAACRAAESELERGALRPRVIHVVPAQAAASLARVDGTTCGVLDGASVCVVAPRNDPFRAVLATMNVADESSRARSGPAGPDPVSQHAAGVSRCRGSATGAALNPSSAIELFVPAARGARPSSSRREASSPRRFAPREESPAGDEAQRAPP